MRKRLHVLSMVLCCVLICGIFASCETADPSTKEEVPEVKQTVYLPASYKFVGERAREQLTIEKQFTYDDAGRCIDCVETIESEERGHVVNTYQFAYDDKGNLISQSKQQKSQKSGRETESNTQYSFNYTYNNDGQVESCVIEMTYSNSFGDTKESSNGYSFNYDKRGNLITITGGSEGKNWYYYTYDQQDQMIAETTCVLLPEDHPRAGEYKYLYNQTVYERDAQGKITSMYAQYAYSTEQVGQSELDQIEFEFEANSYAFHYDENGNLTGYNLPGVTEPEQHKYDENGQWIPEEKHEIITQRGEEIDLLLAKYTLDEQGNVIKFENYQYCEEVTYTELELTQTQATRIKHFFGNPASDAYMGELYRVPGYVFKNFYPDWKTVGSDFYYFLGFFENLPW